MRLIKKKYIVFGILSIAFLSWQYSQMRKTTVRFLDHQGTERILSLPEKDKKRLFDFMEILFAEDNFAYTLLGSKPVSWATYHNPLPFTDWTWDSLKRHCRKLRAGWKTWEKYRHLFPTANFWVERPECYPGSVSILLINEDQFNAVVNSHKKDFQEILNREIVDGFQLLRDAKNRTLMHDVLKGDQVLMGIVLGYGRENSLLFLESCKTLIPAEPVWGEDDCDEGPLEIPSEMTLTEFYLTQYSCPVFAGNPNSEESLTLKSDYLKTKEKVLQYYQGKDFLEASLSLIAGYRPEE
ncbi:MAG: hypothetical protein K1000chlam3_01204 [Chlamydiae bacterium]|nr:hypothetical protein [Chlamydiota bacterium]